MATTLLRHQRRDLALRLIQRGLRTTPVHLLTGLPESEVRTLYRLQHGHSPPSGPMATSAGLFPTRRDQVRLSVFAALYRRLGGCRCHHGPDPEGLLKSFDLFDDLRCAIDEDQMGHRFDFTDAWVIARDLYTGRALLQPCSICQVDYLVAEGSDLPPTCPFCALRKERRRQRRAE